MFTVGQKELRRGLVSTRVRTSGSIGSASNRKIAPCLRTFLRLARIARRELTSMRVMLTSWLRSKA